MVPSGNKRKPTAENGHRSAQLGFLSALQGHHDAWFAKCWRRELQDKQEKLAVSCYFDTNMGSPAT